MPVQLEGNIIFITGGAKGIGGAATTACIEAGASVVAVDVDASALEELANTLNVGDRLLTHVVDVSDEDSVKKAIELTRDTYGRIDGCFNNAGIAGLPTPLPDTTHEDFDRIMRINLYGMFYVLKHTMAVMREQKSGSIVNTASTGGLGGVGNTSPYVASKHAAVGLTLTAGLEGGAYGVRVNAVCPGWVWTPIQKWVGDDVYSDPTRAAAIQEQLAANVPLRRFAQPDEIARAVTFLLSDESSYITGETLRIDGGMLSGYVA
jgi:NAD(P)-dependent dehydrogenase (short-subunit alcohol dehydrogenase family)